MSSAEYVARFSRYFSEALGQGNLELIDELFSPDCVVRGCHISPPIRGIAELKQRAAGFRATFPEMTVTIDDVIAGDDHVVVRWTQSGTHDGAALPRYGLPASDRRTAFAIPVVGIFHLKDGKITDYWDQPDLFGLSRQLAASP